MSSTITSDNAGPFVVVLGLDLTDTESSGFAFDQAARMVGRIPDAVLHVLHVLAPEAATASAPESAGLLRLYVSEKAVVLGAAAPARVGIHVRRGDAAREIAQLAVEVTADVIVVGSHKAPVKNLFLSTTAERVMAVAACPVFVAGPRPRPQLRIRLADTQLAHVRTANLATCSLQVPASGGLASGASSSHLAGARRVSRFGHRKCPRDGHAARLFKPS
ncbi:MAG: universal stress protein, partial [Polyangiaceae bacterium]